MLVLVLGNPTRLVHWAGFEIEYRCAEYEYRCAEYEYEYDLFLLS